MTNTPTPRETARQETAEHEWRLCDYETCPLCGDEAEVFTKSKEVGYFYDGEKARCYSCKHEGSVTTDDGNAYINWND